jgi:hypothetical protein
LLFAFLKESGEVIGSEAVWSDEMGTENGVHLLIREADLFVRLYGQQVFRGRLAADHSVCLVRNGCLVDDRVEYRGLDSFRVAPRLREDMVDVEGHFLEIQLLNGGLPEEVLGPLA